MIAIIDYGAGNILSVQKALDHIGCGNVVTSDAAVISAADGVVLPGVGAFGDAMSHLRARGLEDAVKEFAAGGRPFLGICLGLQVLFDHSEESPEAKGLSLLPGRVKRFPSDRGLKIPQIGWNSIEYDRACLLFKGLPEHPYVYFVHSYYLEAADESIVSAVAEYGIRYHAAVAKDNVFATQFHPEKSGSVGLRILRNFAELVSGDCE